MAKFINKKEQVFDLKLTTYGRKMLSVGSFKPTYYAFYDDNVIYDRKYANFADAESQNDIHYRIKNETQYLEGLTLFDGVETTLNDGSDGVVNFFNLESLEAKKIAKRNIYRFDSAIGDAFLDGDTNVAPAWKIVTLQGRIVSSSIKNEAININIPQIDIDSQYTKKIQKASFTYDPQDVRVNNLQTDSFIDNRIIKLNQTDPLIYIEEANTRILTENFDIEVFEVLSSSVGGETLKRKFFKKQIPQIVDGIMVSPTKINTPEQEVTIDSVEYYFDILVDHEVQQGLACKGAEIFNKQAYYVNLDFDCDETGDETLFYDIYGTVVEPDICQS